MPSFRKLSLTLLLAACFGTALHAQQSAQFTKEDKEKCSALVDAIRARIDAGEILKAQFRAIDLLSCLTKWTSADAMIEAERDPAANELSRYYALPRLAKLAVDRDLDKAEAYANQLLEMASKTPGDWNYGNAVHDGNMVLGRVALKRGDIEAAKRRLLAAGQTPGSPQLNSFGPNMSLAKDLIERGERETVLEYFSLCRKFWKTHINKLDNWTDVVKAGHTPDFEANLLY